MSDQFRSRVELGLDGYDGVLERESNSGAEQDLVSYESSCASVDVDGVEKTSSDRSDQRSEDEEGPVVS